MHVARGGDSREQQVLGDDGGDDAQLAFAEPELASRRFDAPGAERFVRVAVDLAEVMHERRGERRTERGQACCDLDGVRLRTLLGGQGVYLLDSAHEVDVERVAVELGLLWPAERLLQAGDDSVRAAFERERLDVLA